MKASASDLFKDKKSSYPASVPRLFVTSHLCELKCIYFIIKVFFLAEVELNSKVRNFDPKNPDAGAHKVIKFFMCDMPTYKEFPPFSTLLIVSNLIVMVTNLVNEYL